MGTSNRYMIVIGLCSSIILLSVALAIAQETQIGTNGLCSTNPSERITARNELLKGRQEIIAGLLKIAEDRSNEPFRADDPRLLAISLLADYRAEEAIPFLIKDVERLPADIKKPKPSDYPCVTALIKIGKPASRAAAIKVAQMDVKDELQTRRDLLIHAVIQIEGEEIGEALIEKKAFDEEGYPVTRAFLKQRAGERRVRLMKAGQGEKISIFGTSEAKMLMGSLGEEFTHAKKIVQIEYKLMAVQIAVATFINNPASDMLLLEGSATDAAIKPVKDKWDEMVAKGMQKHTLASKSVAIVVNSVNKLDSLTLDQLRDVFTGTTSDWNILGKDLVPAGTGDVSSPVFIGPNKPSADARRGIIRYGLASPMPGVPGNMFDPYFALFTRTIGQSKLAAYQAKKDSAETIAAVAMDPASIAFVDASQLSTAAGKAIKVLAIGEPDKAVLPKSDAVIDGTYPLTEPITLYFMPKPDPPGTTQPAATQPATSPADLPYKIINLPTSQPAMTPAQTKADFVAFIVSGEPVDTFRKHGLVCQGMEIIPPPPATKPAVEPAKNPKDKPKPSKPTDTQPAKPDLPVWK